jgi:hypothetical protein
MRATAFLALLTFLGACDDEAAPADQSMPSDLSMDLSAADGSPDLSVAACVPPPSYPAGPYGFTVGRVMEDLVFAGKHDTNGDGKIDSADPATTIALSDYYQSSSTHLLAVIACATWCTPCVMEQPGLNTLYATYHQQGVAFLGVIMQGISGAPAAMSDLNSWGNSRSVPYDLVVDPNQSLGLYLPIPDSFPMQMLVRTSDMRIVWQNSGAVAGDLQAQIDANLPGAADAGGFSTTGMTCDLGGAPPTPDAGVELYCQPCTSDGDCAALDGICAQDTMGGHFCTKPCATADDCGHNFPGYAPFELCANDPGGKGMVCLPKSGACHGAGGVCDPCRPNMASDCTGGTMCSSNYNQESFCSQQCTVTADDSTNTWVFSNDTCPAGTYCFLGGVAPGCGGGMTSCTLYGRCAGDPTRMQPTCQQPLPDGGM